MEFYNRPKEPSYSSTTPNHLFEATKVLHSKKYISCPPIYARDCLIQA